MNFLKGLSKLVSGEFFENESMQASTTVKPMKYTINGIQIQEDKLLSEGGYGYVWRAHDINDPKVVYAVKRMICQGEEKYALAQRELEMMYKLPQHPNIVRFIEGEILKEDERTSQAIFVMEYCGEGTLFNLMESRLSKGGLEEKEILSITLQICQGLAVLHAMNITHRDLKIENVLMKGGKFLLCDFGSATKDIVDLSKLDRRQLGEQEEIYERYTTLQSRPPEMCDVYCGEIVSQKVDAWMLGCMIYCMCFMIHPFYDASKLAILGAHFKFKLNSKFSDKMHDFIRHILTPSPKYRPDINQIISIIESWDSLESIPLNEQAKATKEQEQKFEEDMKLRDEKVKLMIARNRAEEQQAKLRNKELLLQHEKQNHLRKQEESNEDWGDFQKGEDSQNHNNNNFNSKNPNDHTNTNSKPHQLTMDEIDFQSFNQLQNTSNKNNDINFDFTSFS